jgi:3-hydroxybutyrate dehydrogenase
MAETVVAIITGSVRGVGLGIAEALAAEGMDIVLNGSAVGDEVEDTCRRIHDEYCVRVMYSAADLAHPDEVRGMVDAARRELGRVDVLVNNAYVEHVAPVQEYPVEHWDNVLAVNLSAAFHAIAAALPYMLQRDWGRIVNIACVHGLIATTGRSAYVAARHGVIGLTKAVALETVDTGVTCNAICPSLGTATPNQIGALASFLCSEDARHIRGAALPVDGGLLAQ